MGEDKIRVPTRRSSAHGLCVMRARRPKLGMKAWRKVIPEARFEAPLPSFYILPPALRSLPRQWSCTVPWSSSIWSRFGKLFRSAVHFDWILTDPGFWATDFGTLPAGWVRFEAPLPSFRISVGYNDHKKGCAEHGGASPSMPPEQQHGDKRRGIDWATVPSLHILPLALRK
jgi:hypothetical protein